MISFLLKGLLLGFSIAAPVGPIGLFCIRRTLAEGKASGFVSGLGAATADAIYGLMAAFGLTAVSSFLIGYQQSIHIVGGLFLFYLAIKIFLSKPVQKSAGIDINISLLKSYTSTLFLTLTNPLTIISFTAVFAGFGIGISSQNYLNATLTVLGVFLGSAFWWFLLSGIVGLLHDKISNNSIVWINRVSGILMFALGLFTFII